MYLAAEVKNCMEFERHLDWAGVSLASGQSCILDMADITQGSERAEDIAFNQQREHEVAEGMAEITVVTDLKVRKPSLNDVSEKTETAPAAPLPPPEKEKKAETVAKGDKHFNLKSNESGIEDDLPEAEQMFQESSTDSEGLPEEVQSMFHEDGLEQTVPDQELKKAPPEKDNGEPAIREADHEGSLLQEAAEKNTGASEKKTASTKQKAPAKRGRPKGSKTKSSSSKNSGK